MFAKDYSENDRFLHLFDFKLIMNTQKQLKNAFPLNAWQNVIYKFTRTVIR